VNAKQAAAEAAVELVQTGMKLGLGTGSTTFYAIQEIARRIQTEHLEILAIATSHETAALAAMLQIPLTSFAECNELDLTIDGADEIDERFTLIKGGGGALVREKIVASRSKQMAVIADDSKRCHHIGKHAVPIAVLPFGHESTGRKLAAYGQSIALRTGVDGTPFISDDGMYLYDLQCDTGLDPLELERATRLVPGVVEIGIFNGLATVAFVGYNDGHVEKLLPHW
jgi:ribose 5-phosphate isomerase A